MIGRREPRCRGGKILRQYVEVPDQAGVVPRVKTRNPPVIHDAEAGQLYRFASYITSHDGARPENRRCPSVVST
jgi:hypothetical protein